MTTDQVRNALKELHGDRSLRIVFVSCSESLTVANAFLVPEESDSLVKLTDGKKEYVIEAERIAWVEIG
jgi:hypothetical protein